MDANKVNELFRSEELIKKIEAVDKPDEGLCLELVKMADKYAGHLLSEWNATDEAGRDYVLECAKDYVQTTNRVYRAILDYETAVRYGVEPKRQDCWQVVSWAGLTRKAQEDMSNNPESFDIVEWAAKAYERI